MCGRIAFVLLFLSIGLATYSFPASGADGRGERILIKDSSTLFITDLEGTSRRKIAENVEVAALSGDGNLVAYVADKAVHVFSLSDNQSVSIGQVPEGWVESIAWSPDEKIVAYDVIVRTKGWDLFLASYPPSGDPRNVGNWYETVSFSPDGKFIVHPALEEGGGKVLETVNVATAQRETIYRGTDTIWQAKYSPDGSSIAFTMAKPAPARDDDDEPECGGPEIDLWILPLDSKKPVKILDGVFDFDWSPDGRLLVAEAGTEDCGYPPGDDAVFISTVDGKNQFQLSKNAPSMGAKFSPDSKKVIFVDYNASHFMIGDVSTHELRPFARPATVRFELVVYDWK